jgi:hypothetical protein
VFWGSEFRKGFSVKWLEMRIYNVYIWEDAYPVQVEADSKAAALAEGLREAAEAPVVGRGFLGAEGAGSDGPSWCEGRPARRLASPYACLAGRRR